jgi:hypothetical protein
LYVFFFGCQVNGELPFLKCKAALDSVQFEENPYGDEMGSILADIVAQFAQDVRCLSPFLTIFPLFYILLSSKGAIEEKVAINEDKHRK